MIELAKQFFARFAGLDRAHGAYHLADRQREDGKAQGRAEVVHSCATPVLWKQHLQGEYGLGIFPLRDDGTVVWGGIDVDVYDLDLKGLEKKIVSLHLPLIVCRSKSGGAHLYLFLSEPVDAKLVRGKLMEWAVALGYSGVEVFPKQTRLASDKDFGNWLNMPYFGERSTRYALKKGKAIDAAKFIVYATDMEIDQLTLEEITIDTPDLLEGAPPCLQSLARTGFPEGQRNHGLFNMGVYARNRWGADTLGEKLDQINQAFMDPPLGHTEVAAATKSLKKKDYGFKCEEPPIKGACNRQICLAQQFGVGAASDDPGVDIGGIIKLMTVPATWIIEVNGMRLEMDTPTLKSQARFSTLVLEKLSVMMKPVKGPVWTKLLSALVEGVEERDAPPDAGPEGLLLVHLEEFCTSIARAQDKSELMTGRPWVNGGRTYFRSADFQRFLEGQRFKGYDGRALYNSLRNIAGVKHGQFNVRGKCIQWWSVPSFPEQTEDFDVPQVGAPDV